MSKNDDRSGLDEREAMMQRWAAQYDFAEMPAAEERRRLQGRTHYVGFDNSTLLSTSNAAGWLLYTEGLRGCNALVLASPRGTYMAHMQDSVLVESNDERLRRHTASVVREFERQIGERPKAAYLVTGDRRVNPSLEHALMAADIAEGHGCFVEESSIGMKVGDLLPKDIPQGLSNERHAERRNLLPRNLQWEPLFQKKEYEKGYMAPTESSMMREQETMREFSAKKMAESMRSSFTGQITKPIPDQPYMKSTISSRAKENKGRGV